MKKILLLLFILTSSILFSQEIELETGDKTIEVSSIAPNISLDLENHRIRLRPRDVDIMLYNMDKVVQMMDFIDEQSIAVEYNSVIRIMYIGLNRRFMFRVHVDMDGSYKASISLVNQEQIARFYMTREEFSQLISLLEDHKERNDEVLDQIVLLNKKTRELNQ